MDTYNGNLYVAGGYNGTSALNTVIYTSLDSAGNIGSWSSGTSFSYARYGLSMSIDRGYLYITGGYDGTSTYYADTQFAPIQTTGGVGSWDHRHKL